MRLRRSCRFIPAGAGNTASPHRDCRRNTVHPRWRGEHMANCRPSLYNVGSSPLARGTPRWCSRSCCHQRFIPAGAGNTSCARAATGSAPVHPRWRGEHRSATFFDRNNLGSSPLARGTPRRRRLLAGRGRFIPAGAGNTSRAAAVPASGTVHPRWRGEHNNCAEPTSGDNGSSPLARGTPKSAPRRQSLYRFIPAGAGNTADYADYCAMLAVHPRWRGEHYEKTLLQILGAGSSPLARGTPQAGAECNDDNRFIPAGAGNT